MNCLLIDINPPILGQKQMSYLWWDFTDSDTDAFFSVQRQTYCAFDTVLENKTGLQVPVKFFQQFHLLLMMKHNFICYFQMMIFFYQNNNT